MLEYKDCADPRMDRKHSVRAPDPATHTQPQDQGDTRQQRKEESFQNWGWVDWIIIWEMTPTSHPNKKISHREIADLNIEMKK